MPDFRPLGTYCKTKGVTSSREPVSADLHLASLRPGSQGTDISEEEASQCSLLHLGNCLKPSEIKHLPVSSVLDAVFLSAALASIGRRSAADASQSSRS